MRLLPLTGHRRTQAETVKVFDVNPPRATIAVHGCQPVVVTFTPTGLQTFVNVLDIQIEETTGIDRAKGITFEVVGEGTLPRVDVLEPSEVNRQQEPLLGFLSTRLGDSAVRTVRLLNAGPIECVVDLLLPEGRDVFEVVPDEETLPLTVRGQEHGMISGSGYVLGTLRLPTMPVVFRLAERCMQAADSQANG
ncbi:hydrocephalus-inducing protein-like [Pollicipes pollicipes]|uniref:hydrocephalus-inducing protein-like n=1 Tax=Pollicipes pollicipes TaxID=41117 RepID=UPI001884BE42|nr:hydrocephalus-inducing protein-like [Pollicipes pollicipes]